MFSCKSNSVRVADEGFGFGTSGVGAAGLVAQSDWRSDATDL